ncbi:MAG: hypothetical protein A2887_04135 [Alphaproteobacteria bacterium RIFCSPLOWO2_01_FULL_40_26]|nr:MAG: hypothetical protein A2887_04135 [Alphaproteobacteria bacterium RIFCSPLOWO2_01_FULL_40_26]
MVWQVIFTKKAQKQINALDRQIQSRIKKSIREKLIINPTPITFKKPRFKFTDSKLNHKSHHTVTPHLLRGPSRQRLDFIGCDQMDPATSAG